MKFFGFLVEKLGVFLEPSVPEDRLSRANPPGNRLIDEAIKTAFDIACMHGELDTGADLLMALEKRLAALGGRETMARQAGGSLVRRMRGELHRRHVMGGTRPPMDLWSGEIAS